MDVVKTMVKAVIAIGLIGIWPGPQIFLRVAGRAPSVRPPLPGTMSTTTGPGWFQQVKPSCNPVEVDVRIARTPAPDSFEGRAHEAACYALAGRIERARAILSALPESQRWKAAGITFDVAHHVADAGDDSSAGPIMELVLEFWPNHYMALYHAGAARYAAGANDEARGHLERFLSEYHAEDGWRRNAHVMLDRMGG